MQTAIDSFNGSSPGMEALTGAPMMGPFIPGPARPKNGMNLDDASRCQFENLWSEIGIAGLGAVGKEAILGTHHRIGRPEEAMGKRGSSSLF